jgi:hypothetical protein
MVEQLTDFPRSSAARARVTKDDYTRVLIPAALGKLRTDWKVRMYYKIAEDFSGFYPGAMCLNGCPTTGIGWAHRGRPDIALDRAEVRR